MTDHHYVPHVDILTTPASTLDGMTIQHKMLMVKDIRNFIGFLKDGWEGAGYADTSPPPENEIQKLQLAEKIGITLFNSIGFPQSYWDNSDRELQNAKNLIEQNAEMKEASTQWAMLSEDGRKHILQKAVNILATEQSKSSPIQIIPAQIEWVRDVYFEGNALTSIDTPPDQYKIQLNAGANCRLANDCLYAIKSALHEQIHIKHANYTHAYSISQLPLAFNTIAIGFIMQEESYIPPFRSETLWAAQLGEREALQANNLDIKFK